jgi:predicted lipid-binding transport protein (Tim44 family)
MASPPAAPPAAAAPPPAAAPATAAKTSPIIWILGGCFGLLVLGAIAGGMVLYYIGHKAKDAARMIEKNPGYAVARIIAAAHPDVDVVHG